MSSLTYCSDGFSLLLQEHGQFINSVKKVTGKFRFVIIIRDQSTEDTGLLHDIRLHTLPNRSR